MSGVEEKRSNKVCTASASRAGVFVFSTGSNFICKDTRLRPDRVKVHNTSVTAEGGIVMEQLKWYATTMCDSRWVWERHAVG